MSSVPVQFLIYVVANTSCSEVPVILPLTNCLEVQVGIPISFTLYVMNECDPTTTAVTDIFVSMDITGMTVSTLYNSTTNASLSYTILQWTPASNQIGSQQFCAIAYARLPSLFSSS